MQSVLEVALFNVKPGLTDEAVIKAARAIQIDLEKFPGYLKRELFKGENHQWLDLVHWRSLDDAQSSAGQIMSGPNWPAFEAVINPDGGRMIHATPQVIYGSGDAAQGDKPAVIDLVLFRTLPGVTDEQNLKVAEDLQPVIQQQPGYLKLELYKSAEGEWVEVVYWESSEAARAGNERVMASPEMGATYQVLDPETVLVMHLRRMMAFAPEVMPEK
jgi:heme-degrading monooxygenase HmoA